MCSISGRCPYCFLNILNPIFLGFVFPEGGYSDYNAITSQWHGGSISQVTCTKNIRDKFNQMPEEDQSCVEGFLTFFFFAVC